MIDPDNVIIYSESKDTGDWQERFGGEKKKLTWKQLQRAVYRKYSEMRSHNIVSSSFKMISWSHCSAAVHSTAFTRLLKLCPVSVKTNCHKHMNQTTVRQVILSSVLFCLTFYLLCINHFRIMHHSNNTEYSWITIFFCPFIQFWMMLLFVYNPISYLLHIAFEKKKQKNKTKQEADISTVDSCCCQTGKDRPLKVFFDCPVKIWQWGEKAITFIVLMVFLLYWVGHSGKWWDRHENNGRKKVQFNLHHIIPAFCCFVKFERYL